MNANVCTTDLKWGDIILVDFGEQLGSEQCGKRPALVIQNDIGNKFSPTVIICGITSANKKKLPTHVDVYPDETGLEKHSVILAEQVRTISKNRIVKKCGSVNSEILIAKIQKSLAISFGLVYNNSNTNLQGVF